jgi:hypothetical protein
MFYFSFRTFCWSRAFSKFRGNVLHLAKNRTSIENFRRLVSEAFSGVAYGKEEHWEKRVKTKTPFKFFFFLRFLRFSLIWSSIIGISQEK